jgi:hypothetical protein
VQRTNSRVTGSTELPQTSRLELNTAGIAVRTTGTPGGSSLRDKGATMVVDHADRHHGQPGVVENVSEVASATIVSDQRMDMTAWQNNANRQKSDAWGNVGGNDWSGEPSIVGQDPLPNDRK